MGTITRRRSNATNCSGHSLIQSTWIPHLMWMWRSKWSPCCQQSRRCVVSQSASHAWPSQAAEALHCCFCVMAHWQAPAGTHRRCSLTLTQSRRQAVRDRLAMSPPVMVSPIAGSTPCHGTAMEARTSTWHSAPPVCSRVGRPPSA